MSKTGNVPSSHDSEPVAVIGMSGRFPGADDLRSFWQNLRDGVESIRFFTDAELIETGLDPRQLKDPNYVSAGAVLSDVERFDATFFGVTPREAALMDPQHRLFLECCWDAVEHAGIDPERFDAPVGVYAGASMNAYFSSNLYPNRYRLESFGYLPFLLGNDKDFLATRVSYKLNLRGPSMTIQTSCSTSLATVHVACQGLLTGECDLALAGGVSVRVPQRGGYVYQEGSILSPDGHCRAFDAEAAGTVSGSGVGVVVLRRLADALASGDVIHAVIMGSAVNNDGSRKVGYTAPSVDGQAAVIAEALSVAGVDPETIGYVEAHGTGTALGDPVEVTALTQAFGTKRRCYCAIGSIKTNIGHLDAAAGVAGLIKTVLALKHRQIPRSLHFHRPNPAIDFDRSPFYVNDIPREWDHDGKAPRRAGVSSFGIGGTNVHVVLEEAPKSSITRSSSSPWHLFVLSAKTLGALDQRSHQLAAYLRDPEQTVDLKGVCYTLQTGRTAFAHRRATVAANADEAAESLSTGAGNISGEATGESPPLAFLFPGQGAQYAGMSRELYEHAATFRKHLDACADIAADYIHGDIRDMLYPTDHDGWNANRIDRTEWAQPALFAVEYALARLLISWGIEPAVMLGHSLGEYVAACLSGVFELEEGMMLTTKRGRLMQSLPEGAMLAVGLPADEVSNRLEVDNSIAAINGPALTVVSGAIGSIAKLQKRLDEEGIFYRRLQTSHAFHSSMMDPVLDTWRHHVATVRFKVPRIPVVSSMTGEWLGDEVLDSDYWVRQLRLTVQFDHAVSTLLARQSIVVEVGPSGLSQLVQTHRAFQKGGAVVTTMRRREEDTSDLCCLLHAAGQLWTRGVNVSWDAMRGPQQKVALPGYPFERERHWIDAGSASAEPGKADRDAEWSRRGDPVDWFYVPTWRAVPAAAPSPSHGREHWLIFGHAGGLGLALVNALQKHHDVSLVTAGDDFVVVNNRRYKIDPARSEDYVRLLTQLKVDSKRLTKILHVWTLSAGESLNHRFEENRMLGYYSLLYLAQALAARALPGELEIFVVSDRVIDVTGLDELDPEKATMLGPCKVIPQEYPNISVRFIDVACPELGSLGESRLVKQLLGEMDGGRFDPMVAYRGRRRWVPDFEPVEEKGGHPSLLRARGVYLITGGLGKLGLLVAQYLARTVQARLILLGRSALPDKAEWQRWCDRNGLQDETSRKIRALQTLEGLGSEVTVIRADVTDERRMREVVDDIVAKHGALHGVFHAAGITEGSSIRATIPEIGRGESETQFGPKIHGLYALERSLQRRTPDFCMLFSSLAAVLGGMGLVAYSSANLFMDAFVVSRNDGIQWMSVNWEGVTIETTRESRAGGSVDEYAMNPDEFAEALGRLLTSGDASNVVISTGPINARLRVWIERDFSRIDNAVASPYLRSDSSSYVAPRSETERQIAAIWEELTGVDRVGVEDDFFEIGGHSLLAIQIMAHIREVFRVDLPMRVLFESPTVARLASVVVEAKASELDDKTLDALLARVEQRAEET